MLDRSSVRRVRLGRGELWALSAALAYALNHVFLGVAVRGHEINNVVVSSLQGMPTFLFALAVGWGTKRRNADAVSPLDDWRLALALAGTGLLLFAVANPLFFAALEAGGVLITSPVIGTQVLWGALLAALFLRQPFNRAMACGMLASLGGVFLLGLGQSGGVALSPTWWLAVPYATGTALCWSLASVLMTYAMRRSVDRFQALTIIQLTGIVLLNAYLLLMGDIGLYVTTSPVLLLDVLVAGLFSMVALISLTSALALTSVASASTLSSLQVGLAPLIAWAFVGEEMNGLMGVGILLILAGVIVVQRARGRRRVETVDRGGSGDQ
jgi:drug/metabolite transporter (DMT)-like permease